MRHLRTRPTFDERTMPFDARTCRCWSTAGSDMESGCASSPTEAGPRHNRSTIARRVGSASAWKTPSSAACWLSMFLTISRRADWQGGGHREGGRGHAREAARGPRLHLGLCSVNSDGRPGGFAGMAPPAFALSRKSVSIVVSFVGTAILLERAKGERG